MVNPDLEAKKLFVNLQRKYPGRFQDGQLRTLQRRVKTICCTQEGEQEHFLRMLKLMQGKTTPAELLESTDLGAAVITSLLDCVHNGRLRYRKRAVAILASHLSIQKKVIAGFLLVSRSTVQGYIARFAEGGVNAVISASSKKIKKHEDPTYREALFEVLHAPPSAFAINRTSWRLKDIQAIMKAIDLPISVVNIRKIIKAAGYRTRKAKKVLTSTDPDYKAKLQRVTGTLSDLKDDESFFMVDEFGPFAVKIIGGRALTSPTELRTIPQWQRSKGSLIVTAALELSTNQMTHFYSDKKNTVEMIKLLKILLEQYKAQSRIFFSWDAASWHASKKLFEKVDEINASSSLSGGAKPTVELVPLPAGAQFLNVVESVFSGLARAVLHNSDYQSVIECKEAIDWHFDERNHYFRTNPKRAGNKIWGKERVPAVFSESNNCKDPRW